LHLIINKFEIVFILYCTIMWCFIIVCNNYCYLYNYTINIYITIKNVLLFKHIYRVYGYIFAHSKYWYLVLGKVTKNMFLRTVCFITFLTVSKIHFSKPNDATVATSAVSFDRLELQIKKESKYNIMVIYYSRIVHTYLKYLYFIIFLYWSL